MNFTVTYDKYILYIIEEVASKFVVVGITASIIVNLFHELLSNFRKPENNRFQGRKINQTIKINTLIKVDVKSKIDASAKKFQNTTKQSDCRTTLYKSVKKGLKLA